MLIPKQYDPDMSGLHRQPCLRFTDTLKVEFSTSTLLTKTNLTPMRHYKKHRF